MKALHCYNGRTPWGGDAATKRVCHGPNWVLGPGKSLKARGISASIAAVLAALLGTILGWQHPNTAEGHPAATNCGRDHLPSLRSCS